MHVLAFILIVMRSLLFDELLLPFFSNYELLSHINIYTNAGGTIMAVGASKPTVVADSGCFFSVKSKMLVISPWSSQGTWCYSTI